MSGIYLDNAATSFPKPRRVIEEMERCMRFYCGNPGRSSHALAMKAAEKIYECRCECASFFGSAQPQNVVFCANATTALNTVIKGLLRKGDHVLISDMEHNAVLRPVHRLTQIGEITYDVFPTFPNASHDPKPQICTAIARLIRRNTRMLICAHASNICSAHLPLREIGKLCRNAGILFVVDAAQSAGHLPIHMEEMQIDALCVPGHKGLLGPQGSAFFILREGLEMQTLTEGGSGAFSLDPEMPSDPPERYEAGTLATPSIVGLLEGIREVKRLGLDRIFSAEQDLNRYLQSRLEQIPNVRIYAPNWHGSVLLFNKLDLPSERLGEELNKRGFYVRSGFHCTSLGHKTLGTSHGGAVRVSPSRLNTRAQMDAFADAVVSI